MIVTCKNRISFLWITLAVLPWVAVIFKDKVMGIAFTFSMRKFVENPAALTFLLTLPGYISWIVPPAVNFLADRIWTRWGRRKPFITVSWIGTITCIGLMPLAGDFYWLLAAYTAFCVFNDLGGPVESLQLEIVPPAQRASSQAVLSWLGNIASLTFWVVAIGRFDEMNNIFGLSVSGEQGMYWAVSIGMVVMLLFLTLGIKETNPHSALRGQRFTFGNVFRGLFSKHIWPVYILAFSVAVIGTGLGAFNLLLITEQWGYTKQEQGTNIFIGGILNMFLIPLLGLLSNKVGRGKVYVGLVIAGVVVNFAMFLYYNFVLFDARPTLVEMVVFGEMLSIIGILTGMALVPFVYDFIPRNELGTYAAGSGLVSRLTNTLTPLLMGLFVTGFAEMFLGPPGEMVRVTLQNDQTKAQVMSALNGASWKDPNSGAPLTSPKLTAQAWYATGAVLDHGRGFEIRLLNKDSTFIREQRDRLDTERGQYRARRGYAQNRLSEYAGKAATASAASAPATAPAASAPATATATAPATRPVPVIANAADYATCLIAEAKELAAQRRTAAAGMETGAKLAAIVQAERESEELLAGGVKRLDAILDARASAFKAQVQELLADKLLPDGNQVLAAGVEPAAIATFPLTSRPDGGAVEKTLNHLRLSEPATLDLRVVPAGQGLALAYSAMAAPADANTVAKRLQAALLGAAQSELRSAIGEAPAPPAVQPAKVVRLDLRIIEDPLDRHPSPITRVVNRVIAMFTDPPTPERRVNALGRNLRRPGFVEHASAALLAGDDNAVRLLAIVGSPPADAKIDKAPDAVSKRLASLLGPQDAAAAANLYAIAVPAAKEQRMTVAGPVLTATFAKQQYDFLVGYVAVFGMQLIGLGIVFYFLHMVKTGRVRRRGAEEAEAVQ